MENALLIYHDQGREALTNLYQGYIEIAIEAKRPFVLCTPTWRANRERVAESQIELDINGDAVQFMKQIRATQSLPNIPIMIGGLIGCKNDCYQPNESLAPEEAKKFHTWQLNKLVAAGVDFLMAVTLPSVGEAIGIAQAMAATKTPYIISFVINRTGQVLDGMPLAEAVKTVDSATPLPPMGYMVNCAYPSFLCAAQQPKTLFQRLIGFQANASSLEQCDLDGACQLKINDISDWGQEMLKLNHEFGVTVLGGCCGTGQEHLRYLVQHIKNCCP